MSEQPSEPPKPAGDIKPTLLRVMTDLYVKKADHTPEEEQHYTDLALRLIEDVDAETRTDIATKLSAYATPPAAVLQRLLRDAITLSESVEDVAAKTDSPATGGTSIDELSELFFAADTDERRLILLNLEYAPLPPAPAIDLTAAAQAVARLEHAALSHHTATFVQELERILAIPRAQAQRLVDDPSGEPIVVAASALAMPPDVLQRVLLCLNPHIGQSVQRVYELVVLYEELDPAAALRLLAIWRATGVATPLEALAVPVERTVAPHQPQYWHVEGREQRQARPLLPARPKIRWDEHEQSRAEGA
jgi:hypothetical protein